MKKGAQRLIGLAIFVVGFALVLAVHPDRWSGWALWAVCPLLLYFLYLLAFRWPPQRLRLLVAGSVVSGYALMYGLAAGVGDESYKGIAWLVYVGLPTLGLLAFIACVPVVELVGALARRRVEASESRPSFQALPLRHALIGGAVVAAWAVLMLSGWPQPNITVAADVGGKPAAVAEVRCEGEDTFLSTPTVVRQTDGIHVQVTNAGDGDIWLEYEVDNGSGGGGGEFLEPGISARVIRQPASSIGFACTKYGDGTADEHARATIVPAG